MKPRGTWGRRVFALATIALSLAIVAPELAAPAGAAAGTGRRHPARTEAQRKARIVAAMRAKGLTPAAKNAKLRAAVAKYGLQAKAGTGAKKPRGKAAPRTAAQRQRALRARRLAARRTAARRAAALGLAARRAPKKESSLSVPFLAFLALLPFVLIGLYLLGADYWRKRETREPRGPRKRGGASLVITRVGDR